MLILLFPEVISTKEFIFYNFAYIGDIFKVIISFFSFTDVVCPESDVHQPYPGDCTRYITCRNYKAHIRACPRFMKFDTNTNRCRYATDAKCDDTKNDESKTHYCYQMRISVIHNEVTLHKN